MGRQTVTHTKQRLLSANTRAIKPQALLLNEEFTDLNHSLTNAMCAKEK